MTDCPLTLLGCPKHLERRIQGMAVWDMDHGCKDECIQPHTPYSRTPIAVFLVSTCIRRFKHKNSGGGIWKEPKNTLLNYPAFQPHLIAFLCLLFKY